jgi:monoamine oxidase
VDGGLFTLDLAEVSLLHVLFMIRATGSIEALESSRGGVETDRIQGGVQPIANRIAAELGEQVRLESPMRAIAQDAAGITVHADNITVRARRVIVALPPALTGHLHYDPLLPVDRLLLNQRMPTGAIARAIAVYDELFWRTEGLRGHAIALNSPVNMTIDQSPESGRPGMLSSYASGPAGRAVGRMDPAERRKTFLKALTERFGPKAAEPTHYIEADWGKEAWTQGGMISHFPPGVLTGFGPALRAPIGRIHWACTETATRWHGQIEGAIRSGERTANEVMVSD